MYCSDALPAGVGKINCYENQLKIIDKIIYFSSFIKAIILFFLTTGHRKSDQVSFGRILLTINEFSGLKLAIAHILKIRLVIIKPNKNLP